MKSKETDIVKWIYKSSTLDMGLKGSVGLLLELQLSMRRFILKPFLYYVNCRDLMNEFLQ